MKFAISMSILWLFTIAPTILTGTMSTIPGASYLVERSGLNSSKYIDIQALRFIQDPDPDDLFVVLFLGTDCPISQKYMHTLREMYDQYEGKVTFYGLVPKNFTQNEIANFQEEYNVPFELIEDKDNEYARLFAATITPECFLFNGEGELYYDGAIDDWFYALGRNRPKALRHYLRDAMDNVISGKLITTTHADAIGCLIEHRH